MKSFYKLILGCLAGVLLLAGVLFWLPGHYVVPVIMYHNVQDNPNLKADTVSPETFTKQMEYLKTHGYDVISLDQLIEGIRQGHSFPYTTVVLTFDDGYKNNYSQAFPVLIRYHFPATFFVSPGYINNDQKGAYMNWREIKEMADAGMALGSHGMTQAYLPDISDEKQDFEILESKEQLEQAFGIAVNHLAYPVGGFNSAIKEKVSRAGYKSALTTNRGYDRFNHDVYELNRIRFSDKDNSAFILWFKLNGFYNLFRRGKDPY